MDHQIHLPQSESNVSIETKTKRMVDFIKLNSFDQTNRNSLTLLFCAFSQS